MKSNMKFGFMVIIVFLVIEGWWTSSHHPASVTSLLLDNVEALAQGESGGTICYGIGSIDCPYSRDKVYFVNGK